MDTGWYVADSKVKSVRLALRQASLTKLFGANGGGGGGGGGGAGPSFFKLDFHVKIDQ